MISNPFALLRRYENVASISLLTKTDQVHTDDEIQEKIGAKTLASLWQMHGPLSIIVREGSERTKQADGILTDTKDLSLTIRVADCQAFVFLVPEKGIIGLLHAGWRGLVAGTIPECIRVLKEEWKIDPSTVLVGAGPSLCTACAEFSDPVNELPGIDPSFFHGRNVDLRGIADSQLRFAGIRAEHIERHADCTRCHPDLYWSFRGGDRTKVEKGWTNVLTATLI
jgi:YfiH family protein